MKLQPTAPIPAKSSFRRTHSPTHADVAIVGAGPAGLAAAVHAADGGASVVLIDAAEQLGGQFWRHRSTASGVVDDGRLHHGWKQFTRLQTRLHKHISDGNITWLSFTSVWMIRQRDQKFTLNLTSSSSVRTLPTPVIHTRAVVLATGGYDRQLPVPGWELPGVMAAGGIQAYAKQNGSLPGSRFLIAGTGPFLLPVAHNVVTLGGSVAAVCESANLTGWLPRAHRVAGVPSKALEGAGYAAAFFKHRIPYKIRTVVTEIMGDDQVEAARTARVKPDGSIVAGTERLIEGIDAVGLGWGFTPQLELPVSLGVTTRVDTDGSLVANTDDLQESNITGLFLAGEITGVGGSALAVLEGEIAGVSVAAQLRGEMDPKIPHALSSGMKRQRSFADAMHRAHPVPKLWDEWLTDETVVCRCEEVSYADIRQARSDADALDARTQKGVTRAGMGWCQGRVCGFAVSCLSATDEASTTSSLRNVNKRPIAQPLPLGELAALEDSATK